MTNKELQTLCLKHRLSVEELFARTGQKPNEIRGYLRGSKKIPEYWTEEFLLEAKF